MAALLVTAGGVVTVAAGGTPTSAADALEPIPEPDGVDNIPDSGTCGTAGGRWVKFTVPGPAAASGRINSGNPDWSGSFTSTSGTVILTDIVDEYGNPILFDAVAGKSEESTRVWQFSPASSSPLLSAPNDGNFSQFAICALGPVARLEVFKIVVGSTTTASFTISVTCTLPGSTTNVASPTQVLLQGGQSAIVETPGGSTCTATDSDPNFTTTSSGPVFVPVPTSFNPPAIALTVTNTRNTGSLTITKVQVGGSDETWTFDVNCTNATGTETFQALDRTLTGSGTATVSGIPTGLSCTVTEDQANSGSFTTTVSPAGAIAVGGAVTFTNTKSVHLTIVKTENGGAPSFVYTFSLTGGPDNVSISRSTTSGGTDALDFGLVKPGTYTLCELAVAAGTTSTLPGGVENPTTGDVCATITLTAGVDLQISVDNQLRLGGQRTIGYWKNWSTCSSSSGNQLANAARTGKTLLDQVLPLMLGNYVVDTCAKGVAVLSSQAGKYAENHLAAQLLAAKANVAVGAACGDISTVIAAADALLAGISYQGPPSRIVGNNHPQRAVFLATAATLDQFNNGLYC